MRYCDICPFFCGITVFVDIFCGIAVFGTPNVLLHPPAVKNGFIKDEAMRLLRMTNSSKTTFEESFVKFKQHLRTRGYPKTVIERSFSGVKFADRPSALTQKNKAKERILPFVTTSRVLSGADIQKSRSSGIVMLAGT